MTKLHYNSMCVTGTVPLDTAQIGPSACPKSKAILATWLVERSIVGLDRTKHLKSISRSFCVSVITDGSDHSSRIWGCKYLLLQRSCLKLQTCACICKRITTQSHNHTSKNTKAWAVSQHNDTGKNTKAWAVSH